jgi:hypothetical protein
MIGLRILLGLGTIPCLAIWGLLLAFAKGAAAFGSPSHQSSWQAILDSLPPFVLGVVLLSVIFPKRRWLMHVFATIVTPCFVAMAVVAFRDLIANGDALVSSIFTAYLGLWLYYYRTALKQLRASFESRERPAA